MNMDLLGFLAFYMQKKAANIIVSNKGYSLSDREAKAYVRWGVENGYKDLRSMPEFEDVKDELNRS